MESDALQKRRAEQFEESLHVEEVRQADIVAMWGVVLNKFL